MKANTDSAAADNDRSGGFGRALRTLPPEERAYAIPAIKSLVPRYSQVWFEIGMGYVALIGTMSCAIILPNQIGLKSWTALPLLSLIVGSCIHYINLFLHE